VITAHLHAEVPPLRCHERYTDADREVFAPLAAIAMRLLSKEPRDRYPGVRELEAALSSIVPEAQGESDTLVHPVVPGLLGREAALSTLEEALTLSRRRSDRGPRIIAVRGGPGAGKTTLLREFKWRAQLAGVQVAEVFCDASPLHLWPIPELVRRLELLSGAPEQSGRPDDDSKLADRAAEAAMAATRRAPLLILVEDLHLASPEAVEALRYVAHAGTGEDRMLMVVSYCPESAPMETGGTLGEHQEIDLRPLRISEVGRLAGAILGRTDEELAAAIHAWTGGNPLFCLETLRAIRARGGETAGSLEGLGVPRRLEEFWVARALEARPAGQRLVAAAAVLGHPVGITELALIAGFERDQAVEELDALASRGLLARLPSGDVGLAHNGLAKGALSLVSQRELEGMHARAARLLTETGAPLAERTHHLLRAGEVGRLEGQALALQAARELIQTGASRAAAKLLRRAVTSWQGEEDADAASLLLAEAYHGAGEYDDAADILDGLLRRLADDDRRAEALSLLGRVRMGRGDFNGAAAAWKDALKLIHDPSHRARLRRDLGRMLLKRGDSPAAVEVTQAALSEVAPNDPVRADLLCTLGMAADYAGETAKAMSCYEEALTIARASGGRREEAAVYTHQAITSQREGDYARALDAYSKSLALAREAGDSGTMAVLHGNLGGLAYYSGEPVRALEHYSAALRLAQRVGRESTVVAARTNLGLLHLYLGEFERAKRELERALAGAERLGIRQMAAQATAHLGELALRLGQPDAAVDHYLEARSRYEAVGMRREATEVTLDLAMAMIERGSGTDLRDASDHLESVQAAIKEQGLETLTARAKLAQARLAAARGEEERALTLFERAAREAQDASSVEAEWEALAAVAEVLLRRGAPLAAKSKLQRAVELLEGVAATLPRELRKSFWQDPRRTRVRRSLEEVLAGTVSTPPKDGGDQSVADMLFRLLEINKRINSDPDLPKLLARIMDSTVELTDAERGFLLLVNEKGELEMTTARDFDQGTPDDAHLQFSRSIAETVLIDGEPVITVNAMDDTRFNEYLSVHQLKLQSVLCIPIRARGRVIGVLYMENRLRRGGFGEPDQRILLAFADQVAIALENSRLMAELTRRTQELERAKEEIEQLYEERGKLLSQRTAQLAAARRDLRRAMDQIQSRVGFQGIVGQSGPMLRIFAVLDRVRQTDVPVVITGESGTGKEMVARAVHSGGLRAKKPFVAINCGAIPETLLESELFGHIRGSFTGADRDKRGLLLAANGGTVFLDEIGDMPLKMQLDLLRVLQEKRIRPLGSERDLEIDVRVLAASNRPLRELIQRGTFREDLYYRLSVVEIALPSLRERADDVPLLVDHFLGQIAARFKANKRSVSREAMRALMAYPWPGNVRQLEHALMNAWVMCDGEVIDVADLTLEPIAARESVEAHPMQPIPTTARGRRDLEKQRILESLEQTGWNKSKAAQVLNMPRRTLYRRLKAYGIQ
jgi:transcriptional regulator with GAF, ATPase, and Fis domain/Tfp pilus assembly protein PilF